MTVAELVAALRGLDGDREVAVTLSYITGDWAPLHDIGSEDDDAVYLFPRRCADGGVL